jgi:tetratricopeptide (TPR) repeat protein
LQSVALLLFCFFIDSNFSPGLAAAASADSERAIAQAKLKIRRKPGSAQPYYELGDAYIIKARESGDLSYLDLAEQALNKSLSLDPTQTGVLRHLAHVFATRHDFPAAAAQAQKAIDLDPKDADAHGVLGDAYLELGKYDEAQQAYRTMISLQDTLSSYSRMSGLKSLNGDTAGAVSDLETAIRLGKEQDQPRESIAWAQWQLGMEHFAVGRLKEAEKAVLASLVTYPNYYRGNAGLAQIRAAQRKYKEAIALYQKALSVVPYPEYATALGDVYQKTGRAAEAKKQYDLVEYIGYLNSLNKVIYNRELVYFYSDHNRKLPEALALAQKEFELRKDIYGYDALAWSLYKNDRAMDARAAMDQALKLNTKDAKLFFHAGMIHRRLGQKEKASEYLQRALNINPNFHVIHADAARRALTELSQGVQGKAAVISTQRQGDR